MQFIARCYFRLWWYIFFLSKASFETEWQRKSLSIRLFSSHLIYDLTQTKTETRQKECICFLKVLSKDRCVIQPKISTFILNVLLKTRNKKKNIFPARIYCRSLSVLSMPIVGNLSRQVESWQVECIIGGNILHQRKVKKSRYSLFQAKVVSIFWEQAKED